MKKTLILTTALMALLLAARAQNVHYGEYFELNSTLNASQSHEYTASDYIDLNTGFESNHQSQYYTTLKIDPYYNTSSLYGITSNTPLDHDYEGCLGFYPLDFHVNESGAATISVPLEFPDGTNGMTPHLSLEYNSQAGNGILGLGWSIGGMSKISRVPYTYEYNDESHSVQFSGTDQLSLDGTILKKGIFNGSACYYPEIYDYSAILPMPDGFKVLKRDGTICTYTAKYYLQQTINAPIEWHLSKVEDTYGNYIEYEYENERDNGSFYPTKIRYSGGPACNPAYEIRFIYDSYNRHDCPKKWFSQPNDYSGNVGYSRINKRLSSIECYHGETKIIKYNLSYTTLDWNISALAYIEKSFHDSPGGRSNYNQIIPLKFVWEKTCHNIQSEPAGNVIDLGRLYNSDYEWYQRNAFAVRFEENHLSGMHKYEHDIVHLMYNENATPHYYLNVFRSNNVIGENGQAYSYNPTTYQYDCNLINQYINDGRIIHSVMPADTDGDGLDEIVCVYSSTYGLRVSLIKPNEQNVLNETVVVLSLPLSNTELSGFQIGDFNGDGLSDFLYVNGNDLNIRMSNANDAFSGQISVNMGASSYHRVVVGDFSGDMKDQIVVLLKNGNVNKAWFYRVIEEQNNTYTIPAPRTVVAEITEKYFSNSCNRLCCGDFNGDGKKDILLLCSGAWRFYYSQGNGLFTQAQLMSDPGIIHDICALTIEENPNAPSYALVSDFDHDGCDDVSISLVQYFNRPGPHQYETTEYKGIFRRDFLIRPTQNNVNVIKIRNCKTQTENGLITETDVCIDSIPSNTTMYSSHNPFLPIMGNHKGTSPNEILYSHMDTASGHSNVCAYLHNTGNFYPDSLTRAINRIITSLGATTVIQYRPVSYQHLQNENMSGVPDRSLTAVLPYNGFMNIVERVLDEVKDDETGAIADKKYRLTRYHYSRPYYHTRGRGFLGFGSVWSRTQGQIPSQDIIAVQSYSLNQTYKILVPDTFVSKHFRTSNPNYLDIHMRTEYTYTFLNYNDIANSLGSIPNGVFAPYLSSSMTFRNDGTPQQYEKTITVKDNYGNVTSFERKYGSSTTNLPYYEKTETIYDNSITAARWIIGVPKTETVTQHLVGSTSDKVVRHTNYQNDMNHGRHRNKVTEQNTVKQLTETYGYDSFGNLDSITRDIGNGSPRIETFGYSADGRFMTARTNAKGHTTHYYYHDATGLLDSVTDPNGLTTKYYYDYLCNLVKTELPSGIREEQEMKWIDTCRFYHPNTYHPDTPDFGAPVYFVWSKRSGEREQYTFYDQHRRKLREVSETMDGKKVYVDYRYHDVTGLLDSVSAPYYPGEHETPQFTTYQYDYLERNTGITRPDGAFVSHIFNGTQETIQGFDGQKRKLDYNPAGLVTKVSDYGNASSSPVEIDYVRYGDGKVKTSKVGGDNATTITCTYDVNRNPATIADPSLGQLTYDYNGFGELVYSATPRDTVSYTYDVLGRMVTKNGLDGSSQWSYDQSFKGVLSQTNYFPAAGDAVTENYRYNDLGRLVWQRQRLGSQGDWEFEYGYDVLGHRNSVTYPSGKKFKWHYDRNGFMDRVTDASSNAVVWSATATDRWGNTTEFTEGNIGVAYGYDPVSGLVTGISARKNGQTLFGQACSWTSVGNLEWRTDTTLNLRETFDYDRFNRLETAYTKNLVGTTTYSSNSFGFDNNGNITQKDVVGSYTYDDAGPYALTELSPLAGTESLYEDQIATYTPFDKLRSVIQDVDTLSVNYDIDRQRVTQSFTDGRITKTKRYFTSLYETVTENGVTKKLHYLTSATGLFAIFVSTSNGGGTMYYTLKDHQGSLAAVVYGSTVERLSYDPWGHRRNTTDFGYDNVSHTFDRGYTLHEHYDAFDLINMNGRLYDPILGRMLSPDIVVQDEQNSQAYNRYSYCFNNPLRFTDPSGYIVTIPPEFEKYYMPQYLDDFERYKTELEKMDAQNVAFNTELSEGKSVTTLTWTLGEDSYQMTIVDHGLKDYEQMCENSCVAAALAAQEHRFPYGNELITEEFIMENAKATCKIGMTVNTGLDVFYSKTNVYSGIPVYTDFLEDESHGLRYYEKRSFDEMSKNNGVFFRFFNSQMSHVMNASQAISFTLNERIMEHEIRLWDPDFKNGKIGGYKSMTEYDLRLFYGKFGTLFIK